MAEVGDLISRFALLEMQCRSDIDRLLMVTEASSLLGFFKVGTFAQVLQHTLEACKVPPVEYAEYDQYPDGDQGT
ncbi:hypothetical protein [Streptomyces sp. NPDC007929]|uniref:hypothetical protein n=1 Tax=unclassified Streptomyces TaxID=2593676 RepID=UPI0036F0E2FA